MARIRALGVYSVLSWLTGCLSPIPDAHVYSLPPRVVGATAAPRSAPPGTLMIQRFTANAVLGSRRLAWRAGPRSLAVGNYEDHSWSGSPMEELQTRLIGCLTGSGVAEHVVADTAVVEADHVLTGRLLAFEQQLTGPNGEAQARLTADVTLIEAQGMHRPLWQRVIDVAVPLPSAEPSVVPAALGRAVDRLCVDLARGLVAARPDVATRLMPCLPSR